MQSNQIITFDTYQQMSPFLEKMNRDDVWKFVSLQNATIRYIKPNTTPEYIYSDSNATTVKKFYAYGGFSLTTQEGNFLLDSLALLTLKERIQLTCKGITRLIKTNEHERFCRIANEFFEIETQKAKVLIRWGKVIAIHSGRYSAIAQSEVFEVIQKHLDKEYPNNSFLGGEYSHEYTYGAWSLADYQDKLVQNYSDAWTQAGYSLEALKNSHPLLEYRASDNGRYTVAIYPKLITSDTIYSLGDKLPVKHHAQHTLKDVEEILPLAFAKIQEGANTLADLISLKMRFPIEAFVAAAEKTKLVRHALNALRALLDDYRLSIQYVEETTAFEIYSVLCEIVQTEEYDNLFPASRIKVQEDLNRLLQLDWRKIDQPGKKNFN